MSISKKNLAWSAALIIALAQIPEIENSVMPAALATAYSPESPTIDQVWVAALLSETWIIGYRNELL